MNDQESRPEFERIAQAFSKTFRNLRLEKRFSIVSLAKFAHVSNRMIDRIEDPKALAETLKKALLDEASSKKRQKSAFSRVVVQLALVLGVHPPDWLQSLRLDWADVDYSSLQRIARRRLARKSVPSGLDLARSSQGHGRIVRVSFVPLGPFADNETPRSWGQQSFFTEFADRVIGSFRYELTAQFRPVPANIRQLLLEGEVEIGERPNIVIGLLHIIARELDIWTFCQIPLLRVRLSFLVPKSVLDQAHPALTWRHVLGLVPLPEGQEPKLIVVQESSAELMLRGICRQDHRILERLDFNTSDLAGTFAKRINEIQDNTRPVILAVDEVTAYEVREKLATQGHMIVDLADSGLGSVPSYPLAIAVHEGEPAFARRLKRIVQLEMFDNHAAVTATMYARFIAHAIWSSKQVARRYAQCCDFFRCQKQSVRVGAVSLERIPRMPSFACLIESELYVPRSFRYEFISAIRETLLSHPQSDISKVEKYNLYPLVPKKWIKDIDIIMQDKK